MPEVRSVTVEFARTFQPVQYESKSAKISVTANFTDAEYKQGAAAGAMLEAKAIVLTTLGLQKELDEAMQQAGAQPPDSAAPTPVTTKGRGGKAKNAEPAKDPAAMDDTPVDQKPADKPAAAEGAKPVTDEELQKAASAASARCGSAAKVKEEMKKAGVARLGELAADKRLAFVQVLEALKKD